MIIYCNIILLIFTIFSSDGQDKVYEQHQRFTLKNHRSKPQARQSKLRPQNQKNRIMEQTTFEFLELLNQISPEKNIECLIIKTEAKILSAVLRIIEAKLTMTPNNDVLSPRILLTILCILKRDQLTEESGLLKNLRNTLHVICQCYNRARITLLGMGIVHVVNELLKKDNGRFCVENETDEYLSLGQIISALLPAISDPEYHDINKKSNKIICKGADAFQTSVVEVNHVLSVVFPTVYSICQIPNCPATYQILLVKMIYWADKVNLLPSLVPIDELTRFMKVLTDRKPCMFNGENIVVALTIMNTLRHKHLEILANEKVKELLMEIKLPNVNLWVEDKRYRWIYRLYESLLVTYWLDDETIAKIKMENEELLSRIKIINSKLDSIVQERMNGENTETSLEVSYVNLRELVKSTLNIPDISRHKGKLTASSEGVKKFKDLVTFIVKTLDAIIIRDGFIAIHPDLQDTDENLSVPINHMDIRLDLCKSPSFNVLLGPSKSPDEFKSNPSVRLLRFLSILYEVNENWGILFGSISTRKLIKRSCFISDLLEEVVSKIVLKINQELDRDNRFKNKRTIPNYIYDIAKEYPFLMSLKSRRRVLRQQLRCCPERKVSHIFKVPRKNMLDYVADNLNSFLKKNYCIWKFKFHDEIAYGNGPTKEFYSEFSRDCERYDKGLWSGESGDAIDGVSYVNPESGLFPSPKSSNDPSTNSCLNAIGVVMAKSIVDKRQMNINFSVAFYKCLFKKNLDAQHLSLIDIKVVMPSIFKFIESLVDALREKWCIRNDDSLSTEEQNQAMSNITCDGCSFEDLFVNFTLPGFPDIEMIEGGSEKILDIDNLEEYLRLIIWWLLYRNPHKIIEQVACGFDKILNPDVIRCFYPHEFDKLLCGLVKEEWTVDYLKKNCELNDFTLETAVVQNLFEVLSSLSASDQRLLLQFVTSSPRLPVGGLAALKPKFRIRRKGSEGDPDDYLPSSSTCVNSLFITEYSSKEALEEKLLLAIREGTHSFHFS